ncbi:xin actin-binding repeat-containing protein 2 [Arapaima gigas]
MTAQVEDASSESASVSLFESIENLPPPPPDLLQVPEESLGQYCLPEPTEPNYESKQTVHKEQYSKQRNLYELKRLYKHIHPEVRKNLERDFLSDYLEWDEILKGEVQSMRWMFENKPLDSIKDETPDEDCRKSIAQQEIIAGSDVKYTTWMFETQPIDALGTDSPDSTEHTGKLTDLARGDVRTATWLFETQPLDTLSKMYQEEHKPIQSLCIRDITGGDVKTARYLFETQHLDSLGHTETIDEHHFLQLKSELETIKGDVKTTTKLFETLPLCVIRGDSGEMLEIKTICREEMEKGDVKTSRWLFETQPMDMINKDPAQVKLVCRVSMEDRFHGGVNKGRWLFETKTLDSIKDEEWESSKLEKEQILGADVQKQCWVFETQPMDTLKDSCNAKPVSVEEVIGGDVQSAKQLFETVPMDALKDSPEVGKLQKIVTLEEEKGDVRHQKWFFENQPLENTLEERKEFKRTVNLEELDKGNVTNCKEIFETMDLSKFDETQKIKVEGVTSGSVKSNKHIFESTPLYALQDRSGYYHEVKTVRREEIVKGDVRTCKWMFETRPIDQFDESISKFQIIKGISKQEIESGDVKTAKWLFETQPLDSIKYFSNVEDQESEAKQTIEVVKGDVKTCRWLFETQPIDSLNEKVVVTSETETERIQKGDVKTCTWLFETQSLDAIRDESESVIETCTIKQEDIQGKDVRMACFLFETENLENITGEDTNAFKRVTEIDIQSGDVSRMKYIFENESDAVVTREEIPRADVKTTTWLFETTPFHQFNESSVARAEIIGKSIKETLGELYCQDMVKSQGIIIEADEIGDVRMAKYKLMNQKAPEIQKEEVIKGDLKNIMMNLLNRRETTERGIVINEEERGNINTTVKQLFSQEVGISVEKEEIIRGDIQEAINNLMKEDGCAKQGILIQEDEKGDVRMTIYSLLNKEEETNKGNVSFYSTCIESGALDYLKGLLLGPDEIALGKVEKETIVGGDIKGTKQIFQQNQQKIEHTVAKDDIIPGDVHNTVKVFMTEPVVSLENVQKEEIVKGDLRATLDSLTHASDIQTVMQSLNEASSEKKIYQQQVSVQGNVKGVIQLLLEPPAPSKPQRKPSIEGDVKMSIKSLYDLQEEPHTEKEETVTGDVQGTMKCLLKGTQRTNVKGSTDGSKKGNGSIKTVSTSQQESHECSAETKTESDTAKSVPAVKNLTKSMESNSSTQKCTPTKSFQSDSLRKEGPSLTAQFTGASTSHISPQTNIKEQPLKQKMPHPESVLILNKDMTNQMSENVVAPDRKANRNIMQPNAHIQGLNMGTLTSDVSATSVMTNVTKTDRQIKTSLKTAKSVKPADQVTGNTEASRINVVNSASQANALAKYAHCKQKTNQKMEEVTASGLTDLTKKTSTMNAHERATQDVRTVRDVETSLTDHRTIVQKHDIKTLKTQFRNLDITRKDKNVKPEMRLPPPPPSPPPLSESEFPLPPPPPPVAESVLKQDSDLPPPPPVESLKSDFDHFPLPPPPPVTGQDYLPPPPSQSELEPIPARSLQTPFTKADKSTVKPLKHPPLYKVPKFEPPKQLEQGQIKVQDKKVVAPPVISKTLQAHTQQSVTHSESTTSRTEISQQEETTKLQAQSCSLTTPSAKITPAIPLHTHTSLQEKQSHGEKKAFKPFKLPPPISEPVPTKSKAHVTKFKTPLMIAEEKYRKQREESEKSKVSTPTYPLSAGSAEVPINAALNMLTTQNATKEQSMKNIASNVCQKETEILTQKTKPYNEPSAPFKVASVKPLTPSGNVEIGSSSEIASTSKQQLSCNVNSAIASANQQFASSFSSQTQTALSPKKYITPTSFQADTAVDIKPHSSTSKTVLTAGEGLTSVLKESSVSEQTVRQDFNSLQRETTDSLKINEVNQIDIAGKQEMKKVPPSITKIPKVTPSFKVKTIKMPNMEKIENFDKKEKQKQGRPSEVTSKQHVSQKEENAVHVQLEDTIDAQGRTEVKISCVQKLKASEKVKEQNKAEKAASAKEGDLETEMKKSKQKSKIEKTEIIPKEITVVAAKGTQEQEKIKTNRTLEVKHVQVCDKVTANESKVQQNFQQESTIMLQKQPKTSTKEKAEVSQQQIQKTSKDEQRYVPMKLADKPSQQRTTISSVVTEETKKWEEIQQLLSEIKELHGPTGKMNSKTVKILLSKTPEWLISTDVKKSLVSRSIDNVQKLKDIVLYVENVAQAKLQHLARNVATTEKPESELVSENSIISRATPKISKICIGSAKVEIQKNVQKEKKVSQESKQQESNESRRTDARVASPLIRMRSPSPTYITIESTRRTESPQRVAPSPPPVHRSVTPPSPPPRMSDPSTSRISRATPSPSFSHSEKLAKLKNTTAKLSQGVSPPPPVQPVQIAEKKSEIVESPSSFHRQIKIETQFLETSETFLEASSVKDKKEFFEEAQKAEVNRTYVRKDPIDIPERLGPDSDEIGVPEKMKEDFPKVNFSGLVHKFESPEQKVYTRKDPIVIAERLGSDTEDADPEEDKKITQAESMPAFNIKVIKTVFESGEQSSQVKEQKHKHEKLESEQHGIMADSSKQANPGRQQKSLWQSSPPPAQRELPQSELTRPMEFSGSKTVSETFSEVNKFGSKTSGSRSAMAAPLHSENISARYAPPTYADVVKGKVPVLDVSSEATPEELLKNFHKTWTETESVFRSLGYSVSEQKTSQVVSHKEETLVTGKFG